MRFDRQMSTDRTASEPHDGSTASCGPRSDQLVIATPSELGLANRTMRSVIHSATAAAVTVLCRQSVTLPRRRPHAMLAMVDNQAAARATVGIAY